MAWLGVLPFFAYATMFLILPAATVMIGGLWTNRAGKSFGHLFGGSFGRDLQRPDLAGAKIDRGR